MFPTPRQDLTANSEDYERLPYVKPTGFREYDARWVFEQDINLMGVQALGLGLGTQLHEMGIKGPDGKPAIVVAHDYRAYSASIKQALMTGLMSAGVAVHDIGLALSPVAYFAQFALDLPAVAMVTASHNENGWTGVKIGAERPLTHGPDEMARLRDIVLNGEFQLRDGGSFTYVSDIKERYLADVTKDVKLTRKLKVVAACGNGTAGAFAPAALEAIGCEVIPLHTDLDYNFPHHNPNPEDMTMLHAMAEAVKAHGADMALGFDGDGDRCGVIDDEGEEIFADKVGLIMARDLCQLHDNAQFVVDVKSTGLFLTDPVLKANGATTDYWKTGHSYMKRRVNALGALAGFEKSGHYFLNNPIGRGYDDGVLTAIRLCQLMDRNPDKTFSDLRRDLGHTWSSPTMAPFCPDERKYHIVDQMVADFTKRFEAGEKLLGQTVTEVVTVNGIRIHLEDGTWGLIRASSNKPSLVVVVESPTSEQMMRDMFTLIDEALQATGEVGEYDQKL
ncbi:MAG: phosphomannomutase/phosphoglucomutase [Alphaproteobacteria bacterium]